MRFKFEIKVSLALAFVVLGSLFSLAVEAISGACSSHGGVNCSRGMQLGGTVYCNDGWLDSIVMYDYMVKCANAQSPEDVVFREYLLEERIFSPVITDSNIIQNKWQTDYANCMNSKYQDARYIDRLNACTNYANVQRSNNLVNPTCPANSSKWSKSNTSPITIWCLCDEGYRIHSDAISKVVGCEKNVSGTNMCQEYFGSHSVLNPVYPVGSQSPCVCEAGYVLAANGCVLQQEVTSTDLTPIAGNASAKNPTVQQNCSNGSVYVPDQGGCVIYDNWCKLYGLGVHSRWDGTFVTLMPNCICDSGYSWDPPHLDEKGNVTVSGTCVSTPTQNNVAQTSIQKNDNLAGNNADIKSSSGSGTWQPGLIQRFWSWLIGLFGIK